MSIYCDHNATTPLHPEALAAMLPFLESEFGNPSSVHSVGSRARNAVESARTDVAALLHCRPADVVFTSGGTESNNAALWGSLAGSPDARKRVLTTGIEHSSVLAPLEAIAGVEVELIDLDDAGRILIDDLEHRLKTPADLVSTGWVNNEIGTIQPIPAVAAICGERKIPLHVDAVQAAGKFTFDASLADFLAASAHKLGGPKGVGALVVRRDTPFRPSIVGGAQERDRRAGTENVAGIVGFGRACRVRAENLEAYDAHVRRLRDRLCEGLIAATDGMHVHGTAAAGRLANTLNVRFEGVRGEALVAALDLEGIAVSSGSACSAGAAEPSHVLRAIGVSEDDARNGVRYSLGLENSDDEIERVIEVTAGAVARIRSVRSVV